MPTKYHTVAEDDFMFMIARHCVPLLAAGDGTWVTPDSFLPPVNEIIEEALNTTHSVATYLRTDDSTPTLVTDGSWTIPPERIVRFDALVRFLYAESPGMDPASNLTSSQWIGRAEAWMLREADHGRKPEAPPRKRKLAGT